MVSKMNSFEGKLTPDQIIDLIAYIKYLSDPEKYDVEYETGEDGTTLIVPSDEPAAGSGTEEKGNPETESPEETESDASGTEDE